MKGLKYSDLLANAANRLLLYVIACTWIFVETTNLSLAQDSAPSVVNQPTNKFPNGAVPRSSFLSTELLNDKARLLSEKLLFQALDGEAFYTIVGQIKPVLEGFWGWVLSGGSYRPIRNK